MNNDKDNDKIGLGGGFGGNALTPKGLAAGVPDGNAGRCANVACQQFSNRLINGYCPICASGQGPAPITGGKTKIPGGGHGFHLQVPAGKCEGGVCSTDGCQDGKKDDSAGTGSAAAPKSAAPAPVKLTDAAADADGKSDCGGKCGGNCQCDD